MERLKLEEVVSASMPSADFPMLRGKVACSQADKDEDSMWPTYDGPEGWDEESSTLRLKHSEEDEDAGVHRAYFPDIMDGCPCHQDLQVSVGEALLMQYVTKYCL